VGFEEKERIGRSFVESFVMRLSLERPKASSLFTRTHAHTHTRLRQKKEDAIYYRAPALPSHRGRRGSSFALSFSSPFWFDYSFFFYFWIYIFSLRLMMIFAQRSVRSTDDVMHFLSLSVSHRRLRRVYYIGSDFRSSARAPTLAKRSRKREP
jgi:hypothetical protein